jgi:protein subunit release factor A
LHHAHPALACAAMIIEIRAAEGGEDAKLLVIEQWKVYQRAIELEGL